MDIVKTTLPIYAHYFHAVSSSATDNLLDTGNLDTLRPSNTRLVEFVEALQTGGILKTDGTAILVPLEGTLVMPADAALTDLPLVLIGHGNARTFFENNIFTPPEFLSFKGYSVLQEKLAQEGIASFSINLNIVNALDVNDDYYQRIEFFFLHLLLLRLLSGASVTIPATDTFPIKYLVGGTFQPMNTALTNADAPGTNAALQALQTLKNSVQNKFDFTKLGFMGHSRGASAVARIFEYFYTGATAGEAHADFGVNPSLNSANKKILEYAEKPIKDHVKCLFALQPDDKDCKIVSDSTMFFVVAGTHDEDVGGDVASIYENVESPKVMFYVHGATHKRFNSVWRSPVGSQATINRMISGDTVIRVLSNRKHDDIARQIFSSFFIATLNNSATHFLYFSRDVRYPVRVDVQRAWHFAAPFQSSPDGWKKFDDSLKGVNIINADSSGGPNANLPFDDLRTLQSPLGTDWFGDARDVDADFTSMDGSAFLYEKPINSDVATMTIPIDVNINDYTHFSLRFAKWYNVRRSNMIQPNTRFTWLPRRVDLRNFTIQLFANSTAVGVKIDGSRINSLLQRAYPTLKYTTNDGSGYYWDTDIVLQTIELHKSEFDVSSPADLATVNKVVIEFTRESYKPGNDRDLFVFNDVLLTHRDFALPVVP